MVGWQGFNGNGVAWLIFVVIGFLVATGDPSHCTIECNLHTHFLSHQAVNFGTTVSWEVNRHTTQHQLTGLELSFWWLPNKSRKIGD